MASVSQRLRDGSASALAAMSMFWLKASQATTRMTHPHTHAVLSAIRKQNSVPSLSAIHRLRLDVFFLELRPSDYEHHGPQIEYVLNNYDGDLLGSRTQSFAAALLANKYAVTVHITKEMVRGFARIIARETAAERWAPLSENFVAKVLWPIQFCAVAASPGRNAPAWPDELYGALISLVSPSAIEDVGLQDLIMYTAIEHGSRACLDAARTKCSTFELSRFESWLASAINARSTAPLLELIRTEAFNYGFCNAIITTCYSVVQTVSFNPVLDKIALSDCAVDIFSAVLAHLSDDAEGKKIVSSYLMYISAAHGVNLSAVQE